MSQRISIFGRGKYGFWNRCRCRPLSLSVLSSTGSSGVAGGESDPAANQSGNKSDLLDDEEDFFDFISRNQLATQIDY
jgi:hypothetical protein